MCENVVIRIVCHKNVVKSTVQCIGTDPIWYLLQASNAYVEQNMLFDKSKRS
jgi:hypothetical protein